jgi:ATP-dependent DNA ligase
MTKILHILNELEATSSRLDKEAIVAKHADNELFKRVLSVSMDPKLNFHISKTPTERYNNGDITTLDSAIDFILNEFATRKRTGNNAKAAYATLLGTLDPEDATVLERVIKRDLRCGVKSATVNKILGENFIYEHPVLLCEKQSVKAINRLFENNEYIFCQLKSDGARATIAVFEDKVVVQTRSGEVLDFGDRFDYLLNYLVGWVLDGELLTRTNGIVDDRKVSNGIINKIHNGTASSEELDKVFLTAWDMIPLQNFITKKKTTVAYDKRLDELAYHISGIEPHNIELIESVKVTSYEEAKIIFDEWMSNGEEGAILKAPCLQWEDKRSKDAVKIKAENTADLKIIGWEYGREGKQYAGMLGALVLGTRDDELEVNAGGGYSEKDRATFLGFSQNRVEYYDEFGPENKFSKFYTIDGIFDKDLFFAGLPEVIESEVNQIIGNIAEILYNEVIKSKGKDKSSLFLPRFVKLRFDKKEANSIKELK